MRKSGEGGWHQMAVDGAEGSAYTRQVGKSSVPSGHFVTALTHPTIRASIAAT